MDLRVSVLYFSLTCGGGVVGRVFVCRIGFAFFAHSDAGAVGNVRCIEVLLFPLQCRRRRVF